MATIVDIAKATGYSTSTVSRALSQKGYCSPEAREAILDAARKLNYSPSSSARSLRSKKTRRILFGIPDILNPFYFEMIRGTTEVLDEHGLYSMLCPTRGHVREEMKFLRLLNEQFGDGMILVSFDFNPRNLDAVRRSRFPVVLTNLPEALREDDRFDVVYVDHAKALYLATEHLIRRGHRRIALLSGPLDSQTGRERTSGYRHCLGDYEIPYDEELVAQGDFTQASGKLAAEALLETGTPFTAVVSSNDLMAMGLMAVFSERNIKIPDDVSLVSLDNTDYARSVHPQLTSVDLNQYTIGRAAAELLTERMADPDLPQRIVRLDPTLVVRRSCRSRTGPIRGDG